MTSNDTLKAASRTTTAILNLILKMIGGPTRTAITNGLPAGSIFLPEQRLILAGTPCTVPLFREAMRKVATVMNVDVLLARHGTYPEVFDVTQFDVAIPSGGDVICMNDLILYTDRHSENWLVPSRSGAFIRLAADGLHVEVEPPFVSWSERSDAVCLAAKHIIRATRPCLEA